LLELEKPKPRPRADGWEPNWDRVQLEYPGIIAPDKDWERFSFAVQNSENETLFFANLAAWKEGRQFQQGKIYSLKNFLDGGYWKTKPKETLEAEPERKPNYYKPPTKEGKE